MWPEDDGLVDSSEGCAGKKAGEFVWVGEVVLVRVDFRPRMRSFREMPRNIMFASWACEDLKVEMGESDGEQVLVVG